MTPRGQEPREGADSSRPTIMLVDDEPAVLGGLRRALGSRFTIHTAEVPHVALQMAAELPDLAVVVSDMRMPGMDGAELLAQLREQAPDVVRILLTGQSDLQDAVAAINEGAIFRFLSKPCSIEVLNACLNDAVAHHQLITAERELQERTLRGSVRALLDTLALADPLAFGRAERIRARVGSILDHLTVEDAWQIEVAAMLSQLGAVTLPPTLVEQLHQGGPVSPEFEGLVARLPEVSADLLGDLPRLEAVRRSILFQDQRFDGDGPVTMGMAGDEIPLGARVLHVATDYDALEARGRRGRDAVDDLRSQTGCYDPDVLDALLTAVASHESVPPTRQVEPGELVPGMVLAADVVADEGMLLCGRGQQVTPQLLARLRNLARHYRIVGRVSVLDDPSRARVNVATISPHPVTASNEVS